MTKYSRICILINGRIVYRLFSMVLSNIGNKKFLIFLGITVYHAFCIFFLFQLVFHWKSTVSWNVSCLGVWHLLQQQGPEDLKWKALIAFCSIFSFAIREYCSDVCILLNAGVGFFFPFSSDSWAPSETENVFASSQNRFWHGLR